MNAIYSMGLRIKNSLPSSCLIVFVLPWLVKWIFGLPWLMLQNFTDGVFYLGYAMHFRELLDRIGVTYYAVRFTGFVPDALAFSLLGPEVGFVVVRYTLAGACSLGLFVLFSRRYRHGIGWFAALAWAFNPAAIRLLQTAYVDVAAASFLCIGICLICLPRVGWISAFLGGIALGMSFWSHLHAAVALVFCGPLLVAILMERPWSEAWRIALAVFVGGLVVTLAGVAFFYSTCGLWDLTSPTRELLKTLKDGYIPAPKLEWLEVVRQCPFWLSAITLTAAVFFLPRRDRFLYGSLFAFGGYILFLLWGDVAQRGYSLSLFYYFSFALPTFIFLVGALAGNWGLHCGVLSFALILPVFAIALNVPLNILTMFGIVVVGALPSILFWRSMPRIFSIAFCISLSSLCVAVAPTSRMALGKYWKSDDFPLLTMAAQLSEALPKYQAKPGKLVFWYDDSHGDDLRMLQSFYLHEFTKFRNIDGSPVPFGSNASIDPKSILQQGLRYLVILAKTPAESESGLERLRTSKVPIQDIKPIALKASGQALQALLVTFQEPSIEVKSSIDPKWILHRKARIDSSEDNTFLILTSSIKWNRDAILAIPPLGCGDAIQMKTQVLQGGILLGLADGEQASLGNSAQLVSPTDSLQTILLLPPNSDGPFYLQLRNFAPHGVPSKILVKDIKIVHICDLPI